MEIPDFELKLKASCMSLVVLWFSFVVVNGFSSLLLTVISYLVLRWSIDYGGQFLKWRPGKESMSWAS